MSKADRRARKRENKHQGRAEREAAAKRAKQRSGFIRGTIAVLLIVGGIALIVFLTGDDGNDAATSPTAKSAVTAPTTTVAAPTTTAALPAGCEDKVPTPGEPQTYESAPEMTIDSAKTYTATMETSCGTIKIELDAKNAPIATNNFVFLAQKRFYDGLKWHRVVKDFVIQGGDPQGDGSGGPGYDVKGETPSDGYPLGSLAAAKGGDDPGGTMGSQFFIVTGQNGTTLPNDYARFGKVTTGLDVAQKMESLANGDGPPTHPLYIFSVSISES